MVDGVDYIGRGRMDKWVGLWNERIGLDDRSNWLWRHRIWSQTSWSTSEWRLGMQDSGARDQKLNSFVPTRRGSRASRDYTHWRYCSWMNGIRHQLVWRTGIAEQMSEHGVTLYKSLGKLSDILHLNNRNNQLERWARPPRNVPLDA